MTIGIRFEQDKTAALPVPNRTFGVCVVHPGQVDKYQTAAFDNGRYSVPRRWAFRAETVKGYVDRVEIAAGGQVIATR